MFVTSFSLLVAAVLSFADVGLRASKSYKLATRSTYAADGAIAAATKRYSTTGPCDNYTAPPINGRSLTVQCNGPSVTASRAVQPVNSLLSLGEGPDGGIVSSAELRLLGDVFSTTTVATSATMIVQGQVAALGTCSGPIQTAEASQRRCAGTAPVGPSTADRSRGRDPDYRPGATVVPVRRTVPSCPTDPAKWLIPLPPGYYDDAAALTALTGGSCPGKVVWLQPGVSYFDLDFRGGTGVWTVNDRTVDVVGGTPKGWDPAARSRPALKVPGSCQTNGDPGPKNGVQLIAGGGTRLEITQGRMELCATPSSTDQQIALFGLRPELPFHTLEATEIVGEGFVSALNAQVLNENPELTATAELTSVAPAASLAFGAFRPGVPSGSLLKSVSLVVRHQEDAKVGPVTVTAAFPGSGCGPVSPQAIPPNLGTSAEYRIDLMAACGLKTPEAIAVLAVGLVAKLGTSATAATAQVDGVVIEMAYQTPVTRKPTAVTASSGFVNPQNALEIGDQPLRLSADAALSPGVTSASVTLAGLGDPLPEQPTLDSAVLRVAHQDVGATGGAKVSVPFATGTCTNLAVPHRPDAITEDRIDLKACGLDSRAKLMGLTATFTATLDPGGATATSRLDGMWLEVASSGLVGLQPPSLRQANNATATVFSNPNRAKVIGEASDPFAEASLTGPVKEATITVGDFNRVPVPPGSVISSARLRVAHQEDANVAAPTVVATVPTVPGYPGGICTPPALAPAPAAVATESVDLSACGLRSPDQLVALTAAYRASRRTIDVIQVPGTATATGFTDESTKGRSIDGLSAAASLTAGATTASVTLTGYGLPALPEGSTIETASLRLAHRDDGQVGSVTAAVSFVGTTCTTDPQPLPIRPGALFGEVIPLGACGLTDPAQLSALRVVYTATLAAGGVAAEDFLDGVELAVTYRPPATARLDGIELDLVFQAPTFRPLVGPSGFDVLRVLPAVDDAAPRFAATGTVYAPTAGVDISMYGLKSQVLTRGLIARSIRLGLRAPDYQRPTGAVSSEVVIFTAYPDRTLLPGVAESMGFNTPDAARALREVPAVLTAVANLDGTDADVANDTANLTLRSYDTTDLADSGQIDAAVLRVRHQDSGNTVTVTVRIGATAAPCLTRMLAPNAILNEDQIDLAGCGLDTMARVRLARVTYTVALDSGATKAAATLDGISLDVLSGPMVRASVIFDRAKSRVETWNVTR